jgi:hypothetical protein
LSTISAFFDRIPDGAPLRSVNSSYANLSFDLSYAPSTFTLSVLAIFDIPSSLGQLFLLFGLFSTGFAIKV